MVTGISRRRQPAYRAATTGFCVGPDTGVTDYQIQGLDDPSALLLDWVGLTGSESWQPPLSSWSPRMGREAPSLLDRLDAFYLEHRLCWRLGADLETDPKARYGWPSGVTVERTSHEKSAADGA